MKKLLVLFALISYVFSETCEQCEARCKKDYGGIFQRAKYIDCIDDCIENKC